MEIDVVTSRSGHLVPKVEGYQIHSVYNPIKEATQFVENHMNKIEGHNKFLIFGGGYAYHINALAEHLATQHEGNYSIFVIEPNNELRQYCIDHNPYSKNVHYLQNTNPTDAFTNETFVKFLIQKPVLLTHQPSFNLNKSFFESFLTYKSSRNIRDLMGTIQNDDFKTALSQYEHMTIDELAVETKQKNDFSYQGLLIQTFASIAGSREEQL